MSFLLPVGRQLLVYWIMSGHPPEPLASVMEPLVCASTPNSAITGAKAELWEKAQPPPLLQQIDLAHPFSEVTIQ